MKAGLTRREAFVRQKRLRKEFREYYYQFGQISSISTRTGQASVVTFEHLDSGVKLEDIPTNPNSNFPDEPVRLEMAIYGTSLQL